MIKKPNELQETNNDLLTELLQKLRIGTFHFLLIAVGQNVEVSFNIDSEP